MHNEDILLPDRGIIAVSGEDRADFLQGIITNDIETLKTESSIYTCFLTPQGKFLHDFFIVRDNDDSYLIDCELSRKDDLLKRLKMFRLRAKIALEDRTAAYNVYAVFNEIPDEGILFADPRDPHMGMRLILPKDQPLHPLTSFEVYERRRIGLTIPDGSRDLEVDKSILLEYRMDELNAIAWDKGCYIGQELTARTKYRGLIKKRLFTVTIEGVAPEPGTLLLRDGIEIGVMKTSCGNLGLAVLKIEEVEKNPVFDLGDITLHVIPAKR